MNSNDIFIIILLWIGWCTVHSGLISLSVTRYLQGRLGDSFRYYRLFYNTFAVVTLVPLYMVSQSIKGEVVFSWSVGLEVLRLSFFIGSLLLFVFGARKYNLVNFLGIEQIKSGKNHAIMSESGALDTSGILGVTRHPWYLAGLMLIWSSQQDIHVTRFWMNCVLSCYFIIGTLLEERKLKLELGQSYLDYCEQVSMLFPFKWLQAKLFKN